MPAAYPTTGTTPWQATLRSYLNELKGVWNVVDQNAVADGTTDNATAINAAITAANTAGGGTVLVPTGAAAFGVGSTITMKANVTLLIFGTIKALASHAGAGITATDVSNIEICGPGTLDMNKAATTNGGSATAQQGIIVKTSSAVALTGVRIRDITVQNSWQRGVDVEAITAGSSISDVVIDHVTVTACGNMGIYSGGIGAVSPATSPSHGIWIRRCIVTNPGVDGIRAQGVSDVHIEANVVTDSGSSTGHGICVGSGASANTTDHSTDFTVVNNKVRGFASSNHWGIAVSARCIRFSVTDNDIRSCNGGIIVDVTDPNNATALLDTDGSLTNNTVQGSTVNHGIYANQCKSLTVTGNTSRGNAGSGIMVASSNGVTAVGNNSKSNTASGIALTGTTAGQGGHTVQGNNVSGNTGADFYNECPVVSLTDIAAQSTLTAQDATAANTTLEKTQFTYVIPANTVQAGTTYRVTLFYMVDNIAGSGTLTLRSYGWNGGLLLTTVVLPSSAGAGTNSQIMVEHLITVRNISTTVGKVMPVGNLRSQFSAVSQAFGGTVVTANTVATASLIFTAQWATANAGNICRLEYAAVEVVKT